MFVLSWWLLEKTGAGDACVGIVERDRGKSKLSRKKKKDEPFENFFGRKLFHIAYRRQFLGSSCVETETFERTCRQKLRPRSDLVLTADQPQSIHV